MWKQYLKVTFNRLKNNKTLSALNIIGLSFGLASTILILLWVKSELSYDSCFENSDRICQAFLKGTYSEGTSYQTTTSPEIAGMLKANYPEVEKSTRVVRLDEVAVKYNDKLFLEDMGGAADPNYFEIFNYDFVNGDVSSVLSEPNTMVITRAFSEKYFGNENPMGKVLTINNEYDFTITGLIEKLPDNAYRRFDFMVPFEFMKELGYQITGEPFFPCSYINFALLKEGADIAELSTKTENDIQAENEFVKFQIAIKPLKDIYLEESGGQTKVRIFLAVAILTLILACINSINFVTGLYLNNIRNVGINRIVGARKIHLFKQSVLENLVNSVIASLIGLLLIKIILNTFNTLTNSRLSLDLTDPALIFIIVGVIFITSFATGIFPAITISRGNLVNIIKNKLSDKTSNRGFQKSLLVFQFVITLFFIVSILVLNKQSLLVDNFNFGYNSSDIVYTKVGDEIKENVEVVKHELLQNPLIESVTSSSVLPCNMYDGSYFDWGIDEIKERRISWMFVDKDFPSTLDIKMEKGRFFSDNFRSDQQSVVVNEILLNMLDEKDPIGKQLTFGDQRYAIIGVIKNIYHGSPLNLEMGPMVYFLRPNNNDYLLIKTANTQNNAIGSQHILGEIKSVCDRHSPERPLQYMYMNEFTPRTEQIFDARKKLIQLSTMVMILISCFGLLGLVMLSASQRIKETGIRKVNGAHMKDILWQNNQDIVKWVGVAFIIACPLSWFGMDQLLQQFANKTELSWWIFGGAGIITLLMAILTVSWQSWKVAVRNPVEALRYE